MSGRLPAAANDFRRGFCLASCRKLGFLHGQIFGTDLYANAFAVPLAVNETAFLSESFDAINKFSGRAADPAVT